jgi:hypothetical protein
MQIIEYLLDDKANKTEKDIQFHDFMTTKDE